MFQTCNYYIRDQRESKWFWTMNNQSHRKEMIGWTRVSGKRHSSNIICNYLIMQALNYVLLVSCNINWSRYNFLVLVSAFACDSDEWQIRVEKRTRYWASEESYKILHGNQVLVTSSTFTDNAVRNYYHCISKFADGKYTLAMYDR